MQSLAKFIRKRDPRHKAHLARQAETSQSQTPGNVTPAGGPSRRRPPAAEEYVEQEWQKVDASHMHADLDWAAGEGEDPEEWECVACRKSFRSEAAWDSHERSKKHMKEVEKLKREMLVQHEEFELGSEDEEVIEGEVRGEEPEISRSSRSLSPPTTVGEVAVNEGPSASRPDSVQSEGTEGDDDHVNVGKQTKRSRKKTGQAPAEPVLRTRTERKAMKATQADQPGRSWGPADSEVTAPPVNGDPPDVAVNAGTVAGDEVVSENGDMLPSATDPLDANVSADLTKREKRRARQAKKVEADERTVNQHQCNVCRQLFASKTKLFSHIKETGHASALPVNDEESGGKSQGKKGKKGKR